MRLKVQTAIRVIAFALALVVILFGTILQINMVIGIMQGFRDIIEICAVTWIGVFLIGYLEFVPNHILYEKSTKDRIYESFVENVINRIVWLSVIAVNIAGSNVVTNAFYKINIRGATGFEFLALFVYLSPILIIGLQHIDYYYDSGITPLDHGLRDDDR